jgi:hypothetical protein
MAPAEQREDTGQERGEQGKGDTGILQSAVELVSTGRILVSVEGIRIHSIREDLSVRCKECRSPLRGSAEPIYTFTRDWIRTSPEQRFGPDSPILKQECRFGNYIPSPFWIGTLRCPNCGMQTLVAVQLVVV